MKTFTTLTMLLVLHAATAAELRFYVTAGKSADPAQKPGIYTGTLDEQTGKLSPLTPATTVSKANFLTFSPDKKFLYAASDELHQVFVSSRTALVSDVLIDSTGAAIGLLSLWGIGKLLKHW